MESEPILMASRLAKLARDLIDYDPLAQRMTIAHDSADGDTMTWESRQNVQPIIDVNREWMKEYDEKSRWGDGDLVARVPIAVIEQLMRDKPGIMRDKKALKAWLNDPDNRLWRTRPGRV